MPLYLSRFSYTPETWARLIANPEDRRQAAESYIESVGGKLHGFWYAFGTYDGYNLWEAPDNVSMAAVALAIGGGGALSSLETTVLLTVDETMDALRKADQVRIERPARSGSGEEDLVARSRPRAAALDLLEGQLVQDGQEGLDGPVRGVGVPELHAHAADEAGLDAQLAPSRSTRTWKPHSMGGPSVSDVRIPWGSSS